MLVSRFVTDLPVIVVFADLYPRPGARSQHNFREASTGGLRRRHNRNPPHSPPPTSPPQPASWQPQSASWEPQPTSQPRPPPPQSRRGPVHPLLRPALSIRWVWVARKPREPRKPRRMMWGQWGPGSWSLPYSRCRTVASAAARTSEGWILLTCGLRRLSDQPLMISGS